MKIRLKKILTVGIISLFAISCSDKKEIEPTILESESIKDTETTQTASNTPSVVASNPQAVVNGGQISAPVATTVNAQPQKVAPGMNPAHGEPGHRCDISVGAPLNSPPGKSPAPAAAAPQPMPMPMPQQQTVTTAKPSGPVPNPMNLAVNPAHGEAGHSCAIAVGAPFK